MKGPSQNLAFKIINLANEKYYKYSLQTGRY